MICPNCQHDIVENTANFCGHCGKSLWPEQVHLQAGRYRIQFLAIEVDCQDMEQARQIAQEFLFRGQPVRNSVELCRTTFASSRLTHPFICFNCHQIVSRINYERCRYCWYEHWVPRSDATEKPPILLVPRVR